ncbi:MAG: redoxin domain-containing protein [Vicinamibacterales bacterium]
MGQTVPSISLADQKGVVRTLPSLMGPKGLMLVFSRSADWCPYCKTQMAELQTKAEDLRRNGWGLAVVTYDAVPVLADFAARRGITYPLLSDPGSETIKRFGILNTTVPAENKAMFGIPFPGTFLLDAKGVVTNRFFEPAYQERVTVGSVLARLGNRLDVPVTKVSSPQMNVTAYATDGVVAPGTNFSVVLDVEPGPKMHVYAPGVTGYKPIALTMQPTPGVQVKAAQYPKSEEYYFAPLKERVQVYQRPFRVVQDLAVDASTAGQAALKGVTTLILKGTLAYQACDDRVCYTPQTVPLTWTVELRALDRDRPRP